MMIFQKSKQIYRDKQNQKAEKKQRNAGEKKFWWVPYRSCCCCFCTTIHDVEWSSLI